MRWSNSNAFYQSNKFTRFTGTVYSYSRSRPDMRSAVWPRVLKLSPRACCASASAFAPAAPPPTTPPRGAPLSSYDSAYTPSPATVLKSRLTPVDVRPLRERMSGGRYVLLSGKWSSSYGSPLFDTPPPPRGSPRHSLHESTQNCLTHSKTGPTTATRIIAETTSAAMESMRSAKTCVLSQPRIPAGVCVCARGVGATCEP